MASFSALGRILPVAALLVACGSGTASHPVSSPESEQESRTEVEQQDPEAGPGPEETTLEHYDEDEEMAPPAG